MSSIVQLVQGSPEWLEYRQSMRNASESAAVLGISPWVTPYQLWLVKTGRSVTQVNAAMARGTQLEPLARAAYEARTETVMQPLVMQDGRYSASLDGITLDGGLIVEIKCPFKGRDSELWRAVEAGSVPGHYGAQVQHQLMVSAAQQAHLWVFDGQDGLLLAIERSEAAMEGIRDAWDGFQPHLDGDHPPPLTEGDTVARDDVGWSAAARAYLQAKKAAEAAAAALEDARDALAAMASHPKECGAGVAVTRFWKQGNVDYKRVPALKDVDLTPYRATAREEVRVTVQPGTERR